MRRTEDEFYIGYLPRAPRALGRRTASIAAGLLVGAVAIAVVLAAGQSRFGNGVFAWGDDRPHQGELRVDPYPRLDDEGTSRLLVGRGKHGVEGAGALADHSVALEGSRIAREGTEMLELAPGTLVERGPAAPAGPDEDLGTHRLSGEIVDSKCFLGVMNLGNLKPHRACAIRCISGGVPPMLIVRDREGRSAHVLLVDRGERPIGRELLDLVALPVTVEGRLFRRGGLLYLEAESSSYRLLR